MLAGMFRFVCKNGLVCGDTVADVRVPHKGDVAGQVIDGAYEVLHGFDRAQASRDAMRAITLDQGEADVFARAALALKYDDPDKPAPVTESQLLAPRRFDDNRPDLWSVFNRCQLWGAPHNCTYVDESFMCSDKLEPQIWLVSERHTPHNSLCGRRVSPVFTNNRRYTCLHSRKFSSGLIFGTIAIATRGTSRITQSGCLRRDIRTRPAVHICIARSKFFMQWALHLAPRWKGMRSSKHFVGCLVVE